MPESYISATDNVVRSFESGFGRGAQMEHEDYTLQKTQQQNTFREQMLNERYALQYKNQLALNATKFAEKAQLISSLSSQKAAVLHNTELINGGSQYLTQEINGLAKWTAPGARGNIKNASALDAQIDTLNQKRLQLANIQPAEGSNGFIDKNAIGALLQTPKFVAPEFTDAYQKSLDNKPIEQQARIDNFKSEEQTREAKLKIAQQKQLVGTNNNLYNFQAANANVFGAAQDANYTGGSFFDKTTGQDITRDPTKTKLVGNINTAKQKFASNPKVQGFLDALRNPDELGNLIGKPEVGAMMAEFVIKNQSKFGNLSSWDDMQKFISFVKDRAANGGKAEGVAARALDKTLTGSVTLMSEPADTFTNQAQSTPAPATPEETTTDQSQSTQESAPDTKDIDDKINSIVNEPEPNAYQEPD